VFQILALVITNLAVELALES